MSLFLSYSAYRTVSPIPATCGNDRYPEGPRRRLPGMATRLRGQSCRAGERDPTGGRGPPENFANVTQRHVDARGLESQKHQ
jgi:hypothetical protein